MDLVLFGVGIGIVIGQTGFPWLVEAPKDGPEVWSLIVGALFCNGPVMLQALALRFGGGSSPSPAQLSAPGSPPEPSSAPSSGGE